MEVERTSEDVRAEHLSLMGDDLGSVYHELWNQVSWLHVKWNRFLTLFGGPRAHVDLLNRAAHTFFGEVQRQMLMDILLHIACVTDPPQTGSGKRPHSNLTLLVLPAHLPAGSVRDTVVGQLEKLDEACGFSRDWRNRHIAHRDLMLITRPTDCSPLDSPTRDKLDRVLMLMRDVMNTVLGNFTRSTTRFEHCVSEPGDADDLIACLRVRLRVGREGLEPLRGNARR